MAAQCIHVDTGEKATDIRCAMSRCFVLSSRTRVDAGETKRTAVEQIVTSRADDGLVVNFAVQGPPYTLVH